ncbi:histidine phosphatase family protein [Candidatus Berkiella aquae]|uniref:Bifunctional RNase H/acid phosphatase n=1 Tax=Candidatus Berkiella aquae TaxID=295108 RepID=A0A0Q9YIC9_9GAMM|nr:histidine phosphatase family protein [Candidatus Berkiella aquae]MCS5709853.1 histidine phosphatase family protein [Candidatus Berkiella aquae]
MDTMHQLGLLVDAARGHLRYAKHFTPFHLNFELVFIRHGETFGNCGQISSFGTIDKEMVATNIKNYAHRIYQGDVDEQINQLTELGKQQAINAANNIEQQFLNRGWEPDIIFHSPLARAKETGIPLIERYNLWHKYHVLNDSRELSFGSWDNRRICDLDDDDACHLFYKDQNALIKSSGFNGSGKYQVAESFCNLLVRAARVLQWLESNYTHKKIILFSHSMFGAACCILLGKGNFVENEDYLAFDGKKSDGTSYIMPHAEPLKLI